MTALLELRDASWLAQRVLPNVSTGCLEWTKGRTADGYGEFSTSVDGVRIHGLANRLALELRLGRPLRSGMCALHTCDNPPCCNGEHLYEGTRGTNNRDRDAKGRSADVTAERNPNAKLTSLEVASIRAALSAGETGRSLAAKFGVTPALISLIKHRRNWK